MAENKAKKAAPATAAPARKAADTEGHVHTRKVANKKAAPSRKAATRK